MRITTPSKDSKKNKPASLKEVVDGTLKKLGFDPVKYGVFEAWDREVQTLMKGCEAVAIQGTKLYVKVPSVIHRQELSFHIDRLLKKLNQSMGGKVVTDVRFELGEGINFSKERGGLPSGKSSWWGNRGFGHGN